MQYAKVASRGRMWHMKKAIELYNDILASQYDEATSKGKWAIPKEINKLLSQLKLVKNNLIVLDLGAGTGQTIKPFVDENCKIYAIDISNEMLKITKQKYPKVRTFRRDISKGLNTPHLKHNSFDVIMAVGVLEFIKNIKRIIREAYQLLKKDGYFLFTYELLLPSHRLQKVRVQYNSEGYVEEPSDITKFKLYRRSKEEINKFLNKVGYKIIRHFKTKAFLKGPRKIPVYYGVVLVKK